MSCARKILISYILYNIKMSDESRSACKHIIVLNYNTKDNTKWYTKGRVLKVLATVGAILGIHPHSKNYKFFLSIFDQ